MNGSSGTSYTAEFWQYDSRLGRRWNVDRVVKCWESSYAAFNNSPIRIADPNGDTGEDAATQEPKSSSQETYTSSSGAALSDLSHSSGVEKVKGVLKDIKRFIYHKHIDYQQTEIVNNRQMIPASPGAPLNVNIDNLQPGSQIRYDMLNQADAIVVTDNQTGAVITPTPPLGPVQNTDGSPINIPAGTSSVNVSVVPKAGEEFSMYVVNYTIVQQRVFSQETTFLFGKQVGVSYNYYNYQTSKNMIAAHKLHGHPIPISDEYKNEYLRLTFRSVLNSREIDLEHDNHNRVITGILTD